MVRVKVRYLQEYYLKTRKYEELLELPEPATIETLLNKLPDEVKTDLLAENGSIKPPNDILVNGVSIAHLNGLKTLLKDGDIIIIVPRPLFVV